MFFSTVDSLCFFLSHQEGISNQLKLTLLDVYLEYQPTTVSAFIRQAHLPCAMKQKLVRAIEQFDGADEEFKLLQKGVRWISLFHPLYPTALRNSYDPPVGLFFKGKEAYLLGKKLTIVGTRHPSSYGIKVVEQCIPAIVCRDWVSVSGLATGIELTVQTEVIRQNGKAIAVLGCGLDVCYPKEHLSVQRNMLEEQLVLSEYPLGSPPRKEHFPMRNRILASLSFGTMVVEAKERSSCLHIAAFALEEGREIFAVPGSVFSRTSVGTNQLIKQGAKLIQTTEDVFAELT
ncbi:DNA-processing protein DprA [Lacticigenium naphthae]|uniref:DNA-processing protein DprA n=1 Tax=Lacticigenium naphthae TaxID=515351 RepID=UPI000402F3F5|nr:DNA-processing protein DprA [Lacticigenium naphthae]